MRCRSESTLRVIRGMGSALPFVLLSLISSCGSSGEVVGSWCPEVRALTTDAHTDLTGKQNTLARVKGVQARYGRSIEHCPGVVGDGIGTGRSESPGSGRTPVRPASPTDRDYVLAVFVRSPRYRPREPLFLDGVRLSFVLTGPIRAL